MERFMPEREPFVASFYAPVTYGIFLNYNFKNYFEN